MVLNSFFDKFIFTSQLKFKDSNFYVMDIPFMIVPTDVLEAFVLLDDPTVNKAIYYSYKKSAHTKLMPKFSTGASKAKFLELAQAFFAASGWGAPSIVQLDEANHRAVVAVSNAPLPKAVVGKATHPIDHSLRAILAAIFSEYFSAPVECVETGCAALHPGNCTFVIKPLNEFDFTLEETQRQLSLSG